MIEVKDNLTPLELATLRQIVRRGDRGLTLPTGPPSASPVVRLTGRGLLVSDRPVDAEGPIEFRINEARREIVERLVRR